VVRWNTDKHYLADLEAAGVPIVPTSFVEPEAEPLEALQAFLAQEAADEFVVKPTVSAGSRDTQRYSRAQDFAAGNHIARLLEQGRSVMLQPYLRSVDSAGETALIYFDGQFSHAIGKGALLRPDQPATTTPHATGQITPREADPAERQLAEAVLSAMQRLLQLDQPLTYARIDLIRDDTGTPRLLELELTEPSLFFAQASGSAERFAINLARCLNA
jgi:O-ureido-D-serine cyclo-ligase